MRTGSALLFATMVCSAMLSPERAASQALSGKSQLVGSWVFVSGGSKLPDGRPVWGDNPKGLLIFMENGRYSSHLMRGDLPKFGSGSRIQGTPEENAAIVRGSIASFGTYTVDEAKKTFTIHWEANTFPNLTGQNQTRAFTINGDQLAIANPAPTAGGPPSELVYRRDK
jgi:hypothetical protein